MTVRTPLFSLVITTAALCGGLLPAGCSESTTLDADGGSDASIVFDARPGVDGSAGDGDRGGDGEVGPGAGEIGSACSGAADCEGQCIDESAGFTGGYCSAPCATSEDCPEGATCTPVGRGQALCLDDCDPNAESRECRAGYGCALSPRLPGPVCFPGCTDDSDCPGDKECDPTADTAGACFDPTAALGDSCADSTDCPSSGFCLGESFAGWPAGTCIGFGCDVDANEGCPGDAECLPSQMGGGLCIDGCAAADECRAGYSCEAGDTFPERNFCNPACTEDSQCTSDRVCNPALGTCDVPFDASQLGGVCSAGRGSCDGGTCLSEFQTGWPDSACVFVGCDAGQPDAEDGCPGDGVCLDPGDDGSSLCAAACESPEDCRSGYSCQPIDPDALERGTACLPACTSDADCGNDEFVCNEGTGFCSEPFEPSILGAACAGPDECTGGRCLLEEDGYPGGLCAATGCRLAGDGPSEPCPDDSQCIDDEVGDPEVGSCLPTCAEGECRDGYACTEGVCRPA